MLLPMFVADVVATFVWHNVVADVIVSVMWLDGYSCKNV